MDREWGMTGEQDVEAALHESYNIPSLTDGIIITKTQDEFVAIFGDLTQTPGSDE